ncbi:MAG TPA: response regulator [Hymenobacter sp.]|uniref:response regulator n=1 Tax=Hymenobacter sp. TaxID=1898978 RepID=UPI002D810F0E|nr:response regulator [Hymenobacter sp.]HET9505069.1 response regulator [Hymenobacter sp.]
MTLTSNLSTLPATSTPTPDAECSWRGRAERQITELQRALSVAQAQAALQHQRYLALLGTLPGTVGLPAAGGQVLHYDLFGAEAETCEPAAASCPSAAPPREPLLARLVEQNPNPVLLLTATGSIRYANAAAQALGDALTHETQPHGYLLPLVRKALRTGQAQQQEIALADRWYLLQSVPGPGETCATLYLTDCTSVHSAEQRLAEQREFYETILDELPLDVAAFDGEHRYRFANAHAVQDPVMREWLVGKNDAEYCAHRQLPAELAAERTRRFELALRQRTEAQWDETLLTPAGPQRVQRTLRPVYGPDGALRLLVGLGLNVTERHHAEQKLVEQRAFYEFVFNQLACDIGIFDAQFRYIFVNERGISDPAVREWVIGRDNFEYFERTGRPRSMADTRHARFEQAVRERKLVTYEEQFARPEGTRHLLRFLQPVFHPDGSLYLIVAYGHDITEQVRAQQALQAATLAAEESSRVKETFLANMSHEIRTPMNAILGMSQLLAKTALSPDQLNYQQAIATSADNLLVIINDVLDLSKLEMGKLALETIGFAPTELLAQIEQTLHFKAAEKGLSLVMELGKQVPQVLLGDPYRIRQVLLNLAGNALKFTDKGHVTIACSLLGADFSGPGGAVAVEFRVTDTGIGIEPEYLETIFQEFSQADSSVSRKFGGTGLGLSICRNLVQLMGGEVKLASQKNKGTTTSFTLRLPIGTAHDLPQPEHPTAEAEELRQHLRDKQVLLVEDNLFNRQIAKSFLSQAGVHVTEAEHGGRAVELLRHQNFDLILMDVQMPVMNGYAATSVLRQQLGITTPIIALTANAINGEREKCLAAGMNGYLAKPFQENQLLQVLSDWLLPAGAAGLPKLALAAPTAPAANASGLYSIDDLLKAGQGDPEFVVFMLRTFIESCQEALQELHQGLREANLSLLKGTAHTLKPSLQHLNAWQALPAIDKLNKWDGDFQPEPLQSLVHSAEGLLGEMLTQIETDLKEQRVLTRTLAA